MSKFGKWLKKTFFPVRTQTDEIAEFLATKNQELTIKDFLKKKAERNNEDVEYYKNAFISDIYNIWLNDIKRKNDIRLTPTGELTDDTYNFTFECTIGASSCKLGLTEAIEFIIINHPDIKYSVVYSAGGNACKYTFNYRNCLNDPIPQKYIKSWIDEFDD